MSSFDRDPEGLSAIIFLLRWLNKFPSTQLSLSQALKHLTVICFGQGHYKSLGITQAQHAIGYTETIKKNYSNLWVKFQRHLNSKICWWWNNACLCIPSGSICSPFHLWHGLALSVHIRCNKKRPKYIQKYKVFGMVSGTSKTWFLKRAWPVSEQGCPEERK